MCAYTAAMIVFGAVGQDDTYSTARFAMSTMMQTFIGVVVYVRVVVDFIILFFYFFRKQ